MSGKAAIQRKINVGPLPPPQGGIAVYLERSRRLHPEHDYLDDRSLSWLSWLRLITRPGGLIVYHLPYVFRIISLYICSLLTGACYELALHGHALVDRYCQSGRLMQLLLRRSLARAKAVHIVNPDLRPVMISLFKVKGERVHVLDPFLPPQLAKEEAILAAYPPSVLAFMANRRPLLIANGAPGVLYHGADLYGFDLCIELLGQLQSDYPQAGLLLALTGPVQTAYQEQLLAQAEARGVWPNVYILTGDKELWPLIKRASVLLRPTLTDGRSVSVQEALYFGCQAVASNVCPRPDGAFVFISGQFADFEQKVRHALAVSKQVKCRRTDDGKMQIL